METKVCTKCGVEKARDEFATIVRRNGHVYEEARCKDCAREYKRQHRLANADHYKEVKQAYAAEHAVEISEYKKRWKATNVDRIKEHRKAFYEENAERLRAASIAYNNTPEGKASAVKRTEAYLETEAGKLKHKCRCKLNAALRAGKIHKPSKCATCGSVGYVEAHHADYSKPFDVLWLCRSCHGKEKNSLK